MKEKSELNLKDEKNIEDKKLDLVNLYCEICKRPFFNKRLFHNHKEKHDNRTFTCLNCGQKIQGKKRFCEHMRSYRFFSCSICGKDIKSNNKSRHLKTCLVKKEEIKPPKKILSCSICDYKSIHNYYMKIHSNIHVKRSCNDCPEEFDNQKLLNKHIQQVHIKKVPRKCKWENCTYANKKTSNVRRHETTCSKGQSMDVVTWF